VMAGEAVVDPINCTFLGGNGSVKTDSRFSIILSSLFLILVSSYIESKAQAGDVELTFTLDGRLFTPAGFPNNSNSTSFRFQIWDPSSSCMLYEETQVNIDLSNSDPENVGRFSLKIGSSLGDPKRSGSDPGNAMSTIFSNMVSTSIPAASPCASGYTPASGAARQLRVYVNDGASGEQQLTPDYVLSSVPSAFVAQTIQGISPSNLIQVLGSVSQARLEDLSSRATALNNLADGTSALYAKSDGSNWNPTGTMTMNNQRLSQLATPISADEAVNKSYSDSKLGGQNFSAPAPTDGQSIRWSTSNSRWEAYSIPAGGTVTSITAGAGLVANTITTSGTINVDLGTGPNQVLKMNASGQLDLGAASIINTPSIKISAQGKLQLGTMNSTQETTLIGALNASNQGATWYNSDLSAVRVWSGSAAETLSTKNFVFNLPLSSSVLANTTTVGLNLGTGLHFNGTSVQADFGSSGTQWLQNSSIPNCLAAQKLQMSLGPVYSWSCVADYDTTSPSGSATGDLSGTYPSPVVAKLQGQTVSPTVPTTNQVLKYNGTLWIPSNDLWESSSGNVSRMSGNVGIGTSSPALPLDVVGSGRFTDNLTVSGKLGVGGAPDASSPLKIYSSNIDAFIMHSTNTTSGLNFRSAGSGTSNRIYINDSNNYYVQTQNGIRMRIYDSDGTVEVNKLRVVASDIDAGSNKVINVANPTAAQDAATKNYVDTKTAFTGVRYMLTNDQTIPTASAPRVNFNTSDYDTGSFVTTGATWHFTAPVTGYYRISAKIEFLSSLLNSEGAYLEFLWNNGVKSTMIASRWGGAGTVAYFPVLEGSTTVRMTAGQFAWFEVSHDGPTSRVIDSDTGSGERSFCTIELISQ
jgi:hypothetical protein